MQRKAELKKIMSDKGISVTELANYMGIDDSTLYRKLAQDGEAFTIKEANNIVKYLQISKRDASRIFFA